MNGNMLEAAIGAVVLVVAVAFAYFAYASRDGDVTDGYALFARFSDVSGISVGSDVKMCGIKIGVVKKLKIDKDYQARVELLIKNDEPIPDDSSAEISSDGIMGNKFISILPGFSQNNFTPGAEIAITKA
ncbi:MAG: MlaD family protein, partial [Holosporales bacterium]|nr:MlaD family protein [Holosporales bacterium]